MDSLKIFAALDEAQLFGEAEIIGSLAHRAVTDDHPFPSTLMRVAGKMLQAGDVHQRWIGSLLVKAMPLMGWPAVAEVLRILGGDLAKLSDGKSAEVTPGGEVDPILDALMACEFASRLTPGKKGKTKVNMKRSLAVSD